MWTVCTCKHIQPQTFLCAGLELENAGCFFFLIISNDPTGEIHHTSLMNRLAGGRHRDETRARKKHISSARYSHFLAEDSDPLGL